MVYSWYFMGLVWSNSFDKKYLGNYWKLGYFGGGSLIYICLQDSCDMCVELTVREGWNIALIPPDRGKNK